MSGSSRSMSGLRCLLVLTTCLIKPFNGLAIAALFMSGCGETGSVAVSGSVCLNGMRTPAEIQIEQLDAKGNRVGRSVTAYADEHGEFSATIEPVSGSAVPLDCRLVVRVSQLSSSGLPAAFDENALPEKSIQLRRTILDNDSLSLLLTR